MAVAASLCARGVDCARRPVAVGSVGRPRTVMVAILRPPLRCHFAPRNIASMTASAGASGILSQHEFFKIVEDALPDGSVDLGGRCVELLEPLAIGGSSKLRIANGTLAGAGHAVLQVSTNRDGRLDLSDVALLHSASLDRTAKRSLGAALFLRGKSNVTLTRCVVSSEAGFGVWVVQKASALLSNCQLPGSGRSSVVAFDQSRIECVNTSILDAMPHAICARGQSRVVVHRSRIERAHSRAVYTYHSASLELSDSLIAWTRSDEAAAIQVDALRPGDAARLAVSATVFKHNAGGDLSVSGNVARCIGDEVSLVERRAESFSRASASVRDEHGELPP